LGDTVRLIVEIFAFDRRKKDAPQRHKGHEGSFDFAPKAQSLCRARMIDGCAAVFFFVSFVPLW
jgi:hypothetical protein